MKSQATRPSSIHHISWLLAVGVLTLAGVVLADVPKELHYQGVLTDDNGDVVDCPDAFSCNGLTYDMTFRLYDQAQGGTVLWEEKHAAVSIRTGLFNLELGSFVPIQGEILSSGTVYLGLTINDTEELQPRQRIVAAAFSIRSALAENALNAQKLAGKDASEYVSGDDLSKTLSDKGILDGDNDTLATLSCDLGDMALFDAGGWTCQPVVDNDTLMALSCNPNQGARWTGQEWICANDVDTTLSDAQVVQIVSDNGFATLADLALVATTGQFTDLLGIPTALTQLGTTADGDLSFEGEPVISQTGQWVGDPTGLVGPAGKDGSNGADGKDGTNALDGKDGNDGIDGKDGLKGANGKDGAEGKDGANGKDGLNGAAGKDGANGLVGAPGKDGLGGATGIDGTNGKDGATGIDGKDGANGIDGATGIDGKDGANGIEGAPGKNGTNGANGKDGFDGATGKDGFDGATGKDGVDGATGKAGTNGIDGKNGANGIEGAPGGNGTNGANGKDGFDGAIGKAGKNGIDGKNGTNGLEGAPGKGGVDGFNGKDGADGENGISVASTIVNNAGQLVITLANGNTTTSESLVGQPGLDGEPGNDGANGKDGLNGANGADGKDGISVASTIVNNAGQLAITLTNGNTTTSESLVGQPGIDGVPGNDGTNGLDGADGENGLNGANGIDGKDGISVASTFVNDALQLVINLTDGSSSTSANLRGAKGEKGNDGTVGFKGKDGANGLDGATGKAGKNGLDGKDGISVASTIVNNAGQLVITLANGNTTTSESLVGQPGLDGVPGNDGTNGLDGADGKNGLNGADGKDGAPGNDGTNGLDGADGKNGLNGADGKDGAPGIDGKDGANGSDGNDGAPGIDGKDGINGKDGALAGLTCPEGDVVRMTATGWDCSPTVALDHNHDEAYVKNTGGTVTGDLIVNGKLTAEGGLDIDVSKLTYFGIKQVDDDEPTTYPVSLGRYHMQLSYAQYYLNTRKVPQEIIDEYCGDEDGCRMVLGMRHYSSSSHEAHVASTTFRFFYETSSGKWRREYPGGSGIDGQNGLQHVKTLYGACYFTDTVYIDGNQQGDNEKGMHLLYWVGYINNGQKKCELTIMD